ncbi:heme peroxidase [Amylocarpus encephaloides]|uniref:Peroxidase n=1 Tax=Amylocarpus encephaloides TaxID=45428 RepID=A0A9P8C8Q3_9HELO|nr:heme peroxidase [Amylocarpus encephaloides]
MSFSKLSVASLVLSAIPLSSGAFYYPNVQESLIEHEFVDAHGAYEAGFIAAITPCSNYASGGPLFGRETAAQWVRVAFHDSVTHHISDGTGGLDASIGFETDRDENVGSAMNDTMHFFRNRVNSKLSAADFLALSVQVSVGNCGGPQIPVRYGRIDATGPGPFGVPAPQTSIEETLEMFAGAGFSQADSIGLAACGHTFGSVHTGPFPDVVPPETRSPTNLAGGIPFDTTTDIFDNVIIHEYIDGTGNGGGPLVTTTINAGSRSDLRLFESDNNATMRSFYRQSNTQFGVTCANLFQRMIETVPSTTKLSAAVKPQTLKPINATLDFSGRSLVFTGYIRTLSANALSKRATAPTVNVAGEDDSTATASRGFLTPEPGTGSSVFGVTTYYPFKRVVTRPEAFTSFTVAYDRLYSFATSYKQFIPPSLVTVTGTENGAVTVAFTVAVYRSNTAPSVTVSVPVAQPNNQAPKIATFSKVPMTRSTSQSGYTLFTGTTTASVWTGGALTIAVVNSAGKELDVLMTDGKLQ